RAVAALDRSRERRADVRAGHLVADLAGGEHLRRAVRADRGGHLLAVTGEHARDLAAELTSLGQHLERDRLDLVPVRLGEDPNLGERHQMTFNPSRNSMILRWASPSSSM